MIEDFGIWGFPNIIKGTCFGVPISRIIVLIRAYVGALYLGKLPFDVLYHHTSVDTCISRQYFFGDTRLVHGAQPGFKTEKATFGRFVPFGWTFCPKKWLSLNRCANKPSTRLGFRV